MKKFNARLPRKMSALIRVAIADIIATEKRPDYYINMGVWHETHGGDEIDGNPPSSIVCHVCFAGSTLAAHGFPKKRRALDLYKDVTADVRQKMYALNCLRGGNVAEAAGELGLIKRDEVGDLLAGTTLQKFSRFDTDIEAYSVNPVQFKRDMRKLATKLKRAGL